MCLVESDETDIPFEVLSGDLFEFVFVVIDVQWKLKGADPDGSVFLVGDFTFGAECVTLFPSDCGSLFVSLCKEKTRNRTVVAHLTLDQSP